jgi:hypothetical protein
MSHGFQEERRFLGITSSPAFVREPEGNGCAERFSRTLKENLLWLQTFDTVEVLRLALHEFRDRLRTQLIELTIFAPTLLGPSGGVATNLIWASSIRAERKDSSLCACPRGRLDNSSTSA